MGSLIYLKHKISKKKFSEIKLGKVIYVDSFICYTSQINGTLAQLNLVHVLSGD